jgi:hypothetical protein
MNQWWFPVLAVLAVGLLLVAAKVAAAWVIGREGRHKERNSGPGGSAGQGHRDQ